MRRKRTKIVYKGVPNDDTLMKWEKDAHSEENSPETVAEKPTAAQNDEKKRSFAEMEEGGKRHIAGNAAITKRRRKNRDCGCLPSD